MKTFKKIIRLQITLGIIFLLPFILFTLFTSRTNKLFGVRSFVVLTGSMSPNITQGSIIFTSQQNEYKKGEVIAFKQGNIIISHRVIDVVKNEKGIFYKTQGDANNAADIDLVNRKSVLGKAENRIPYIGSFILFLRTLPGFTIFIIFPTVIFVVFELWKIKEEIEKNVEKRVLQRIQNVQS